MPTPSEEDRIRITARVPAGLRDTLEEAAELSGATLNQFVVQAAVDRAQSLLEKEAVIHLSREQCRKVFALMDHPPKPNKQLKKAIKLHRELLGEA
mgnify:CR=1 FL=1